MDPRRIIGEGRMTALQWAAVIICVALNALDGFDVLAITFAAPGIAEAWKLDPAEIGLVISTGLAGMAVGSIVLAPLADITGRRGTVLASLCVMAVAMLLSATARSVTILCLWRFVTGLGIGTLLAAINAVTAEYANDRRRALAVSLMSIGYPIGGVLGGAVAAMLLRTHGWQSVFVFGGLVTAAMIVPVLLAVPESIEFLTMRGKGDVLPRINAILRRMGHPMASTLPRREPPPRIPTAAIFAPGMARRTIIIAGSYFLHVATFYYFLGWLPSTVVHAGFAKADGAAASVWANLGGAIGGACLGLLATRVRLRSLLIGTMIAGGITLILFGQLPPQLGLLKAGGFLADFFINAGIVGLYALMASSYPAALRATGTGFAIGVGRAGGVLGPIVGGVLLKNGMAGGAVAAVMALGTIFAAGVIATLPRTRVI